MVCAVAVNTLSGRSGMVTRAVLPGRGSVLRLCGMPTTTARGLRTSDTMNGSAPGALPAFISAPTPVLRAVTTPSNGAVR